MPCLIKDGALARQANSVENNAMGERQPESARLHPEPEAPLAAGAALEPGTLWARAIAQSRYALACGALHPIPTEATVIEQNGIRFLVRILASLARKEAARKAITQTSKDFNPFLPYDRNLFVADLSPTHVCLLNKYNVVDHHLLMITRDFEDQETLLTLADFVALWVCLAEIEGLGFYNSGKVAGASQRHKHLQLVPFPLLPSGENIPIETALATIAWNGPIGKSPALPFQHALSRVTWRPDLSPQQAAQATLETYHRLLNQLGLYHPADPQPRGAYNLFAYNLLVTRQWMLIVPRRQEQFGSIPVNSLGFAGTLFVRNQEQFEQLQIMSPLGLLKGVAIAAEEGN
jgi:sulfate adenylyltransferase (ADP) / ATP adenylyltransferase